MCVWDFTASKDSNDISSIKSKLKEHCKQWSFQEERGETYEHFQGRFSLKIKKRQAEVIKLLKTNWHISLTSNENRDNDFYVCKEDTRVAGPWKDTDDDFYIPRQVREIKELFDWQKQVVADAEVWNTRTINVILDYSGNIGKSILKTYIGCHGIGRSLPPTNNYKDLMRAVMDTKKKKLYIVDMPRAMDKRYVAELYCGIETLKDGYAYDDRYNFKEEYFDCPNIWVFTNEKPDTSLLSRDRWRFWVIKNNKLHQDLGAPL